MNRYEQLLGKEPPKIPPKPPPEQPKACLSLKASISRETGFNTNVWTLTQRPGDIWIGDSASTLNVAAAVGFAATYSGKRIRRLLENLLNREPSRGQSR